MFSMSKLREILQRAENAKIEKQNQEIKRIQDETKRVQAETKRVQDETDLANELANQNTNKTEKANLSNAVNPQQTEADNSPTSKGSVLSRLRVARAIIGTPNSDMGTGEDSLGTFFKKELIQ